MALLCFGDHTLTVGASFSDPMLFGLGQSYMLDGIFIAIPGATAGAVNAQVTYRVLSNAIVIWQWQFNLQANMVVNNISPGYVPFGVSLGINAGAVVTVTGQCSGASTGASVRSVHNLYGNSYA